MDFDLDKLTKFFELVHGLPDEEMVSLVEGNIPDDAIEFFIDHINQFYGIDDEEQLGLLAQLMVVGFMAGKHQFASLSAPAALIEDDEQDHSPTQPNKTGKKNFQ